MTSKQIERNAKVVANGLASDWRNAYVIACSVERPGSGVRVNGEFPVYPSGKTSPEGFARLVKDAAGGRVYGMGTDGVRAALAKWDRVAAETPGLKRLTSDRLAPGDAGRDVKYPNRSWYEEDGNGKASKSKAKDVARNSAAVVEAIQTTPELAAAVIETIIHTPELEAEARTAIARHDEERGRTGTSQESRTVDLAGHLVVGIHKDQKATRALSALVAKAVGKVPPDILEETIGAHCDRQINAYGLIRSQIVGGDVESELRDLLEQEDRS